MSSSSSLKKSIILSSRKLLKRLEEEVYKCRTDERNVKEEMRRIMESTSKSGRKVVADALKNFLEDKYSTKMWIVIVLPERGTLNNVHTAESGGFHTASVQEMFAAANSVDRVGAPKLTAKARAFLNEFKLPVKSLRFVNRIAKELGLPFRINYRAHEIHEYLSRYLTPLRTNSRVAVDTFVIQTPCVSSELELKQIVQVVISEGMEKVIFFMNDADCFSYVIIAVPVNPSLLTTLDSMPSKSCKIGKSGLLRNEQGQAYLSAQKNSEIIVVDSSWNNEKNQRWRFVKDQLKNDIDKCLTASNPIPLTRLEEKDCFSTHQGQIWYRNGLQIVNSFGLCLAFMGTKDDKEMYVVQNLCDTTPPFLWYDWDVDCEDALIIHPTGYESRPLRNEFSRRYLSVTEDEKYASHLPWQNQLGQYWRFVDGQLKNDEDKCLIGKGWFVRQEDCVYNNSKAKKWTFNGKRQIISADGYCMSVGNMNGYISYNYCNDHDLKCRWF